jgi:hypothetical protein
MPTIIIAVVLNAAGLLVIYLLLSRRIHRALSASEVLDSIRDEVRSLVVELNQTTDRNVSLTEERVKQLQRLLGEADRRIQLLGRETDKHRFGLEVYNRLKAGSRDAEQRDRAASDDTSPTGHSLDVTIQPEPPVEPVEPVEEPLSQKVLRLSAQGFDSRIIAQKVGTTLGEVELILSLRRGRNE